MDVPIFAETSLAALLTTAPLRPTVAAWIGRAICRELVGAPLTPEARRGFGPERVLLGPGADGAVSLTLGLERTNDTVPPVDYLSPEQATHASRPDARSDVYSVCVMLYRALSGAPPLPHAATEAELCTILVTHDVRPLERAAPWLDPALAKVIHRGLARDVGARWADPAALANALAPFAGEGE